MTRALSAWAARFEAGETEGLRWSEEEALGAPVARKGESAAGLRKWAEGQRESSRLPLRRRGKRDSVRRLEWEAERMERAGSAWVACGRASVGAVSVEAVSVERTEGVEVSVEVSVEVEAMVAEEARRAWCLRCLG